MGRLVERKGLPWFLREVAPAVAGGTASRAPRDRRRGPDAPGDRVGDPGVGDSQAQVRVLGAVSEARKAWLLERCDAVLMPNIDVPGDAEGFGLVALEAGRAGRWVLVSDLQGLRDAVTEDCNGTRIEPGNAAAWSQALAAACSSRRSLVGPRPAGARIRHSRNFPGRRWRRNTIACCASSKPMSRNRALRWLASSWACSCLAWCCASCTAIAMTLHLSWAQLQWPAIALSVLAFAIRAGAVRGLLAPVAVRCGPDGLAAWRHRALVRRLAGKYFPGKVWMAVAAARPVSRRAARSRVAPAFAREMLLSMSAAMLLVAAPGWFGRPGPAALTVPFSLGAALFLLLSTPTLGRQVLARTGSLDPDCAWPCRKTTARSLLEAWLLQLAGYVALGLGLFALARGIDLPVAGQAGTAVAALCFAGLAGMAAFFVPAGIGVREAALAWYLSPVLGIGAGDPAGGRGADLDQPGRSHAGHARTVPAARRSSRAPRTRTSRRRERLSQANTGCRIAAAARRRAERISRVLGDFAGLRIEECLLLDVGASHGLITIGLAGRVKFAVGVDVDRQGIAAASKEPDGRDRAAFAVASGMDLPFVDGSVDVVACNHVYEHVPDAPRMMREIARVLRPGGACYFAGGHRLQLIEPHYRMPFLSWLPRRWQTPICAGADAGNDTRKLS